MAIIATSSPFTSLKPAFLLYPPIFHPFPSPQLHLLPTNHGFQNPTPFTICHAKVAGAREDENEGIEGIFFDEVEIGMEDESDDENEDEDTTESSLDLLFRFIQSMFKKVSKRTRRASRAILPDAISPQLVNFAVDGVLILASLSIMKAFLEVVCTLGGTVFVAVLALRVIWAAIAYFQSNRNDFDRRGSSYGRTQPVT